MGRTHAHSLAAHDRRIALALFVSLLLHSPLLLPPGNWSIGLPDEASAPPELRIELQGIAETKDNAPAEDAPPEVAALATPAPEPSEVPEPSEAREPTQLDPALADSGAGGINEESAPTAQELPANPMPSTEPTPSTEPMPSAQAMVATIAPAQTALLTRRLESEAGELLASRAMQRHLDFKTDDREFTAVLTRQPAADSTGVERVTVEITSENGGERVRTSLQMKRLAFSHFTQLVDRWDPQVQLHDDEIAGRFHSNSEINLTYDLRVAPRLLGTVTTARGVRISGEKGWRSRRQIFAGGLATGTPRIRLPEVSVPVAAENASEDVHVVSADTLIFFRADGNYDTVELASRDASRGQLSQGKPTYIIGVGDAELSVRGVVNGNVTVYSPRRIVVQGDLTYARDPRADEEADDYLGLVSDGTVEIARADVTGPGDLEIFAAIYARNRFIVRNVYSSGGGILFLYGSLTAGSISETEPRFGTRTEFDRRFERVRPPGFPETDRYEIDAWDKSWRVAEGPQ